MNQRRRRLGDILDDYCPRERRITNHAVVAMVEDDVKQTRCTTCDAEHEYKHAKVPASRKRKTETLTAHLVEGATKPPEESQDIHDEMAETDMNDVSVEADENDMPGVLADSNETDGIPTAAESEQHPELAAAPDAVDGESEPTDEDGQSERDEWPVHRRLIRAQLPRPEGQVPERKAPDFTFRPGGKFDQNRNNGQRHRGHRPARHAGSGQSSGQGQSRFGGQRGPSGGHGGPAGQRQGNRSGQGGGRPGQGQGQGQGRGPRPGGGRKRGR